jgi:hypothetical protein
VSAHASHEEFFLFHRLTASSSALQPVENRPISVSWRVTEKRQPADTKFKVPADDAPNVAGAKIFGLLRDQAH